jgi:hypothetical protein
MLQEKKKKKKKNVATATHSAFGSGFWKSQIDLK